MLESNSVKVVSSLISTAEKDASISSFTFIGYDGAIELELELERLPKNDMMRLTSS